MVYNELCNFQRGVKKLSITRLWEKTKIRIVALPYLEVRQSEECFAKQFFETQKYEKD